MPRRQYAKGRKAIAECQRSGQKMLYRDLVEDGHIPGLLVHPDWWEPFHPQEIPVDVTDAVALQSPAPEISIPAGEGDPEAGGAGACAAAPDTGYIESGSSLGVQSGATMVCLEDAVPGFIIGTCIYIQRDDLSWFVSKARATCDAPTFCIPITTPYSGGAVSPGGSVYVGAQGSGVPVPPAVPDGFILAISESSFTERPRVYRSIDSISTWSAFDYVPVPTGSNQIGDKVALAWNGSRWVTTGARASGATTPEIGTSDDDGTNFDRRTEVGGVGERHWGLAWDGTTFVAVGSGGHIETSTDGVTWTDRTSGVAVALQAVRWTGATFVAVGTGSTVITSPTGTAWTPTAASPGAGLDLLAVSSSGTRWCVGGSSGSVWRSDNAGASWTEQSGTVLTAAIRGLTHNAANTWVACGLDNDVIRSTDNGVTFAAVVTGFASGVLLHAIVYDAGTTSPYGFIAVGNNGSNQAFIATSSDGITWTVRRNGDASFTTVLCVRGKNTV